MKHNYMTLNLCRSSNKAEKLMSENKTLVITNSGLWVSPDNPFLGGSPDGSVYHYSEPISFGFVEVKCPYNPRYITPAEVCSDPSFCCRLVMHNGTEQLTLKESHPYYYQVEDRRPLDVGPGMILSSSLQRESTLNKLTSANSLGKELLSNF